LHKDALLMSRLTLSSVPRPIIWTLGGLIALTAIGLLRLFWPFGAAVSAGSPVPLVTTILIAPVEVADRVSFTGAIGARDEAALSAEEGGRVSELHAEVGDRVRRGQLLARLDNSMVAPQIASLQASLEESRANAAIAEADLRRAQAVAAIGALSAQEIERRGAASVAAQAKIKVVSAQLNEAQVRYRRTEIRAPFDGIVLTRGAEVGQLASPGGAPLFRLGRAGGIEMRGNVAERDLPRLAVGQPASVSVTGVAQAFPGRIRLIGAVIDPQTRLGSMRIDLVSHKDLRPGAFARGEIGVGRASRPIIPQTAVMSDADGNYVFIVDQALKVLRRSITVAGSRPEGVVVTSGLQRGDRIVVTAGPYLRAGETVRIAP
jgi:RND family efflux transporter MFP subunit